jgi:hypothetical protein
MVNHKYTSFFYTKLYFVYILISRLEKKKEKLVKNNEKKKLLIYLFFNKEIYSSWCQQVLFDKENLIKNKKVNRLNLNIFL